jgi:hypothetical protein
MMTRSSAPSRKKSAKKSTADHDREHRLTDTYAAEARRDTLLKGDELSELASVGRKDGETKARRKRAGEKTSGTGRR